MELTALLITIAIGGVAGWLASNFMKSNLSLIACILIGIVGAFLGGYIFGLLGIAIGGVLGSVLAGFIGACLLIGLARLLRRA